MTPRILVVGSGIGGLTLARCLQQRNIAFDLVDRSTRPGAVGAGLTLTINATRLLDALGLGRGLQEAGYLYQSGWIRTEDDDVLQHLDLSSFKPYGEAVALHRADLHRLLGNGFQPQYGQEVTGIQVLTDRVEVSFQTRKSSYELVVAADGLHSKVRQSLPGTGTATYSGYTSWRYTQSAPLGLTGPVEYWGAGKRIGLVPIGHGQLYVFATHNRPALSARPDDVRFPLDLFKDFPEQVKHVMDGLEPGTKIIQTDIREFKTHIWRRQRLAFLGDAAHGMTPNLGQGAATSIEDAVVLAECLYHHGITEQALARYEQMRRRRVQAIAQQSRWLGKIGQFESPALLRARNWLLSKTPDAVMLRNVWKVMIRDAPQPPTY